MGLGAAALAPLCVDNSLPALSFARSFFMHRHRKRSKYDRKRTTILTQSHPKLHLGAQGAPKGPTGIPREPKGAQSDAKESPLGARGVRKGPKRNPKSRQGKQNEFRRHPKEKTKSQNYIHINEIHANSRFTAIQRPASINSYSYRYHINMPIV